MYKLIFHAEIHGWHPLNNYNKYSHTSLLKVPVVLLLTHGLFAVIYAAVVAGATAPPIINNIYIGSVVPAAHWRIVPAAQTKNNDAPPSPGFFVDVIAVESHKAISPAGNKTSSLFLGNQMPLVKY
ncbi:hypothetical protein KCP74_16315 [Salmonella enterica subsp. enterica]|nr:hypothetical protein KCP74_16315 [Salmonella enterica subsp. enterica]